MHVRRVEAGRVGAAHQQRLERAPFQASVPGGFLLAADIQRLAAAVGLVAAITVVACRRGGDQALGQRDLELDTGRIAGALTATTINVLQIEIDAGTRIRAEVIALLGHFGHCRERDRPGPALQQFTGDVGRGLVDVGRRAILRDRAHLPVLVRGDRVPPARFVQCVDGLTVAGGAAPWAEEEVVRLLFVDHVLPLFNAVVGTANRGAPVKAIGQASTQACADIPRQLAVGIAQRVQATDFVRGELAHAKHRAIAVGIPVIAVGIVDQRNAGRIGAPDRLGPVHRQVAPGLQAIAEIEGAIEIARHVLRATGQQPVGVVGAHAAQAAGVAHRIGVVVVDQPISGVVLASEFLAGAVRRCQALACARVDQRQACGGTEADLALLHVPGRVQRIVGVVHLRPVAAEQRIALGVLQCVGHAPVVAGLAARPGQVPGIAPAFGGRAAAHAHFVAVVVGLQDDVDHAGDGVRTIDRRRAAGQHFDALHGSGRNVAVVGEIGLAAIGQRVVGHAAAVDQQQAAVGPHAAQVQAARVGRVRAPLRRRFDGAGRFGERLQRVVDGDEAFLLDLCGGDHVDRGRTLDAGALDARTGNGDGIEVLGGRRRRFLCARCEGQQGKHEGLGQQMTTVADELSHGWLLLDGGRAVGWRSRALNRSLSIRSPSPVDRSKLKHS
ncbi:hypothetical protein D3C81_863810 [compost metagenome]